MRAKRATFTFWVDKSSLKKGQKLIILATFWKSEACGQTVLPDRSILIWQKLVENDKIQMQLFKQFSNNVNVVKTKLFFGSFRSFQTFFLSLNKGMLMFYRVPWLSNKIWLRTPACVKLECRENSWIFLPDAPTIQNACHWEFLYRHAFHSYAGTQSSSLHRWWCGPTFAGRTLKPFFANAPFRIS